MELLASRHDGRKFSGVKVASLLRILPSPVPPDRGFFLIDPFWNSFADGRTPRDRLGREFPKLTGQKLNRRSDRRFFIGDLDARIIMGDDEAALVRLWQEKRGEAEPEDLAGNLIVQLGVAAEAPNRRWYEQATGQVITNVQRHVKEASLGWMAATLDGTVEGTGYPP